MYTQRDRSLLMWTLALTFLVSAYGVYAFSNHLAAEGWLLLSVKLQAARILGGALVALLGVLLGYALLGRADRILGLLNTAVRRLSRLKWGLLPLILALGAAFPVLMYGQFGKYLAQDGTRQMVFLWLALFMSASLSALWERDWPELTAAGALAMAVLYHLVTYFPHVTGYPFALWWSETTRYYLASTFFDQRIYGQDLPLVFRDITRYLIQSFPFLAPESPLVIHRLWQVILRFTCSYLAGYVLGRRLEITSRFLLGLFTAWAGLFLFQGPVFYNLIVIPILAIALVDVRRFWRTMLVVVLVSVYAGLSRINWVPMAGLIAAMYYLTAQPLTGRDLGSVARYLLPPAAWVAAGVVGGIAAQQIAATNSGNPPEIYYSSFTSYLLWDRLFPNPSFPIGILPLALLVCAPLLVYLFLALRGWQVRWHPVRVFALTAILSVLFAGGLVVSVKIGGGTNLHNMDVFLVVLLLLAVEIYFGRTVDDRSEAVAVPLPVWLKAAAVAFPIVFVISFSGLGNATLDHQTAWQDLARLQKYADQATAGGGEVLFIAERHLITFGLIEDVPLVHAHEKLLLQEMAMSQNEVYLTSFAQEMADQKYAMIVTDRLPRVWKDPDKAPLAMENNVVLNELVPLITCAYEVQDRLLNNSLDILTPLAQPTCNLKEE